MTRFLTLSIVGILLLGHLVPTEVEAATRQERRQAGRLFRRGERQYRNENYEGALESFRAAVEKYAHPATHFNIGMCLEQLGRLQEADEAFAAAERGNRRRISRKARYARARLAAHTPTLRVAPETADSSVMVDGEPCPSPCERRLDPGQHEVVVRTDDGEHHETVQIEPRQTFQLALQRVEVPAQTPVATTAASESNEGSSFDEWLLYGGVGASLIGIAGMLYFGLQSGDDSDGRMGLALGSLGLTVVGIGAATAGAVLGEGEREPGQASAAVHVRLDDRSVGMLESENASSAR